MVPCMSVASDGSLAECSLADHGLCGYLDRTRLRQAQTTKLKRQQEPRSAAECLETIPGGGSLLDSRSLSATYALLRKRLCPRHGSNCSSWTYNELSQPDNEA